MNGYKTRERVIFCDFDGTITFQDIGNIILNRFTQTRWDSLDKEFISGRIGSMAAYQRIAPYIKAGRDDVEGFIEDSFNLDEAFPLFIQNCQANKDLPVILSDGFDIYIRILLEKKGLNEKVTYKANQWIFEEGGRVSFSFPYHNPGCKVDGGLCGNCKLKHLFEAANQKGPGYSRIVYIGNGYSDRCPVSQADLVLAKDGLKEYCIEKGIKFLPFNDFYDVNSILF